MCFSAIQDMLANQNVCLYTTCKLCPIVGELAIFSNECCKLCPIVGELASSPMEGCKLCPIVGELASSPMEGTLVLLLGHCFMSISILFTPSFCKKTVSLPHLVPEIMCPKVGLMVSPNLSFDYFEASPFYCSWIFFELSFLQNLRSN